MEENQQQEEYFFEEASFFDSEWFEYSLYSIAIILFGILIVPVLSFNPSLDEISYSLQKSCIAVGIIFLFICVVKLLFEFEFFSSEPPPLPIFDEKTESNVIDFNSTKNVVTINAARNVHTKDQVFKVLSSIPNKVITPEILNDIEWKRFEDICSAYFTEIGLKNSLTGLGADGGIDIKIFDNQSSKLVALVQCKKVNNPVSVKLLREFYGVMSSQNITKGYFITSHTFHDGAIKFAEKLNIELINGKELLSRFKQLPTESHARIFEIATYGDYKTPSCVKCGAKMLKRTNKKNDHPFWACPKFKCRTTLKIKM